MRADDLLTYYERIADAPNAVSLLRRFIRDLAIRGRLVSQDRQAELMSSILKRQGIAPVAAEAFIIPPCWAWVNVGAVAETRLGKMLDKAKNRGSLRRYLRNINVRWFDFDLSDVLEMRLDDGEVKEYSLRSGDVLICEGGEPGRAAVWDERERGIYFQKALHRVRFLDLVDGRYFVHALKASADDGRLCEYFTGTGIQHFTGKSLNEYLIPLPPLAEQHRIVAKIDELMALCDRLEAARAEREATRDRLTAASLARLNTPDPDPATFATHARFALDQLPALTVRPDQIKHLRQTILNLAVRGKLVPQNATDEPASALLEVISNTRKRLYAERRIPKPRALPEIEDTELPFRVPTGWAWSMLGQLCYQVSDGPHYSPQYVSSENGVPFLSTRNVRPDGFDLSSIKYVSRADHEEFCKRIKPELGDIIYTKGGTTGIAKVNDLNFEFSVWVHLAVLRVEKNLLVPRYIEMALNSPHCYEQSQKFTQGISNFDLGLTRMIKITIPLPPLAEQRRIVAKVDELMVLCGSLERSLAADETARRRLLESLLAKALEPLSDPTLKLAS